MRKIVALLALVLTFSSCALDDDQPNYHFELLETVNANFPEEMTPGNQYQVEVTYYRPSSCYMFDGIDYNYTGDFERTLGVVGAVRDDVTCEEIEVTNPTATFTFQPLNIGTYTFKFYSGTNEDGSYSYLTYEVEVTE